MRKLTCPPGTEVSGPSLHSLIQNMNSSVITPILERHHLENLDPNRWYPCQDYLNLLSELIDNPNGMFNMVAIGMSQADIAIMPAGLKNVPFADFVQGWNDHYQANFRNGYVGQKTTVEVDHQHYKIIHDQTIIPDDFEYGILYGFAKSFLPPGTFFTVWYDEDVKRMDEGGDQTIIHVSWE